MNRFLVEARQKNQPPGIVAATINLVDWIEPRMAVMDGRLTRQSHSSSTTSFWWKNQKLEIRGQEMKNKILDEMKGKKRIVL